MVYTQGARIYRGQQPKVIGQKRGVRRIKTFERGLELPPMRLMKAEAARIESGLSLFRARRHQALTDDASFQRLHGYRALSRINAMRIIPRLMPSPSLLRRVECLKAGLNVSNLV